MVLVSGEPGVGKSRLLYEFAAGLDGTGVLQLETSWSVVRRSMPTPGPRSGTKSSRPWTRRMVEADVRQRGARRTRRSRCGPTTRAECSRSFLGLSSPSEFLAASRARSSKSAPSRPDADVPSHDRAPPRPAHRRERSLGRRQLAGVPPQARGTDGGAPSCSCSARVLAFDDVARRARRRCHQHARSRPVDLGTDGPRAARRGCLRRRCFKCCSTRATAIRSTSRRSSVS